MNELRLEMPEPYEGLESMYHTVLMRRSLIIGTLEMGKNQIMMGPIFNDIPGALALLDNAMDALNGQAKLYKDLLKEYGEACKKHEDNTSNDI